MRRIGLLLALAFVVAAPAHAAPPAAAAPAAAVKPVKIKLALDAVDRGTAGDLARDAEGPGVRARDLRNPANAKYFLHIAATHGSPAVVALALRAMAGTYARPWEPGAKNKKRAKVDADFKAVVLARLTAPQGIVRGAAIDASRLLVGGDRPDVKVIDQLLGMAQKGDDATKVAVIGGLFNVGALQQPKATKGPLKAKLIKAMLDMTKGASPAVQAAIFDVLARVGYESMPEKARIVALAQAGLASPEAGVRGTALRVLGAVATAKEADAWGAAFYAGLNDAAPFVKGCAADAIGRAGWAAGAHGVIKLLDDARPVAYAVGGFTGFDGSPGTVDVTVGLANQVDQAGVRAIRYIAKARKAPVKFTKPAKPTPDSVREARKAGVRGWYESNKAKLPAAPAAPAAPTK